MFFLFNFNIEYTTFKNLTLIILIYKIIPRDEKKDKNKNKHLF